jgi:hypothetical protein
MLVVIVKTTMKTTKRTERDDDGRSWFYNCLEFAIGNGGVFFLPPVRLSHMSLFFLLLRWLQAASRATGCTFTVR